MATYYVRQDGGNGNAGTSPSLAWATITYALANMVLTAGDNYLYIAPGVYRESPTVTITPTSANRLIISGDPTAAQFPTLTAGNVRLTGATSDITYSASATRLNLNVKSYITVENLFIEHNAAGGTYAISSTTSGTNITIRKNVIFSYYLGGAVGGAIFFGTTALTTGNSILIDSNIIFGCAFGIFVNLQAQTGATGHSGVVISNNRIQGNGWQNTFPIFISTNVASSSLSNAVTISNCIVMQSTSNAIQVGGGNATTPHIVQNCIIALSNVGIYSPAGASVVIQRNNLLFCGSNLAGVNSDSSTITSDHLGFDLGQALLQGFGAIPFGTTPNSRNTSFGISASSPTTDLYGFPWSGTSPDLGTTTYRSISSVGTFVPSERNASNTIAPTSTSQSIELYLGVTGLTATTAGLNARYNRTRSTSVSIPLVARTITQAWVAGGFAEVNSVNMPGIYRLDLPDAAVASGADDVTVVVRGASGTNGAVVTIKLLAILANANTALRSAVITDLSEDIDTPNLIYQTVGDRKPLYFRLFNADGSNPDLTVAGGTVVGIVHNAYSGVEYTFGVGGYTGMQVNILSDMIGFVEVIPPAIWGTAGMYRLKVRYTLSPGVRIYGPVNIRVGAL